MQRRDFLKLALAAPIVAKLSSCTQNKLSYSGETARSFPFLEVEGSYKEIGYQTGRYFKSNMLNVIAKRGDWIANLRAVSSSVSGRKYSRALFEHTQKAFPHLIKEIEGMAEGSGIGFDLLWMMSVSSELSSFDTEPPGCSTVFYNDDERMWLFHNEDGHAAYKDEMFVLKAHPPSGISYITLVYPGIIPGVGPSLNSAGIIETTNYIGTVKPGVGIPRYFIGRAVLEAASLDEALQIANTEPRAFPWHHNLGSINDLDYLSIETLPDGTYDINRDLGLYHHTNHTICGKTCLYQFEDEKYKNSSSVSRYQVLQRKIDKALKPIDDPRTILNWLSSHEQSPYSPCRHPQRDIQGQTLGTAFFDFRKGTYRIYKNNPCESVPNGHFAEYGF